MRAPAAAEVNSIREFTDREMQAEQVNSEQPADEIRQPARDFEQPTEETGEPGLNSYDFSTPGGIGGE
jgi:hypothetical protein